MCACVRVQQLFAAKLSYQVQGVMLKLNDLKLDPASHLMYARFCSLPSWSTTVDQHANN